MKKIIASVAFVVMFATYAVFQRADTTSVAYAATGAAAAVAAGAATTASQADATVRSTGASNPPKTTATSGIYKDGSYTGDAVSAYYGTVQVQAIIKNGVLADVQFLQYPSDRGTSRSINQRAMAGLAQEAISAQSAQVSGVSGATDTTSAFRQSLGSALVAAHV